MYWPDIIGSVSLTSMKLKLKSGHSGNSLDPEESSPVPKAKHSTFGAKIVQGFSSAGNFSQ